MIKLKLKADKLMTPEVRKYLDALEAELAKPEEAILEAASIAFVFGCGTFKVPDVGKN